MSLLQPDTNTNSLGTLEESKPRLTPSIQPMNFNMKTATTSIYHALSEIMSSQVYDADFVLRSETLFNRCCEGLEQDSDKLLTTLFLKAFNKKIQSNLIHENIYEHIQGVSQIELFDILIAKLPFVRYSQELVNNGIVEMMKGSEFVTILDIGVGLGSQMMNVISKAKEQKDLKKLIIIGLEPFTDALNMAQRNIESMKKEVDFDLEFMAIAEYVERFDFSTLTGIEGALIINASLALHHIQTIEKRKSTLSSLNALNPLACLLIEPNVDHFESDFFQRFKNSYQHFSSLFQVIDQLDIREDQKNGLKLFFGREIEDIIGKPEEDRFEKHMPATSWIQLLRESGFGIGDGLLKENFTADPGVEIKFHPEGYIGFTYQNETVLSILHAC